MGRIEIVRKALPSSIIILVGVCIWSNSLFNGYALDDLLNIRNNYLLQRFDWYWLALTEPAFPGNLYRPLTLLSYGFQIATTGYDPFPFHLLNVAIHLLNGVLVYQLFCSRLGPGSALLTALLFCAHPLTVESVANISGRAELLAACFVLCSLRVVARSSMSSIGPLLLCAIASFAAAASKESGLVGPLLLGLWLATDVHRQVKTRFLRALLASSCGGGSYLLMRSFVMGGEVYSSVTIDRFDNPLAALPLIERLLEAWALLGTYIAKAFYPFPLSADYSYAVFQFSGTVSLHSGLIALLTLALLIIGTLLCIRRQLSGVLILWFFVAFMLTSNIFFVIGTVMAERLTYLPLIGMVALAAHGLVRIPFPLIRYLMVVGVVIAAGYYSFSHSSVWANNRTLADYQEHISANSFRTQLLAAERDRELGQFESALQHLARAQQILPHNDDAFFLEGSIHIEERRYDQAERALRDALSATPEHRPALQLYGRLLLNLGRLDEAEQIAAVLEHLDQNNPQGLMIRLAIALKLGEYAEAQALVERLERLHYQSDDFIELKRYLQRREAGASVQ